MSDIEGGSPSEEEALSILKGNVGFRAPRRWVDYALRHGFREVDATLLECCPDCGSRNRSYFGQYIYYSSLAHLWECEGCDLIWSDLRLPEEIISKHFSATYDDPVYFDESVRLFDRIASIVAKVAPRSGTVLDVGGGLGHLLARVARERPDIRCLHSDISEAKCRFAEDEFHLETVTGGFASLRDIDERPDVVLLVDVLYYTPDIGHAWDTLDRLVSDTGSLLLRVPDVLPIVRILQALVRIVTANTPMRQTRVPLFNPEHLQIFSRRYLDRRLRELGFDEVHWLPSPLRRSGRLWRCYYLAASRLGRMDGDLVLTPSALVVASR